MKLLNINYTLVYNNKEKCLDLSLNDKRQNQVGFQNLNLTFQSSIILF